MTTPYSRSVKGPDGPYDKMIESYIISWGIGDAVNQPVLCREELYILCDRIALKAMKGVPTETRTQIEQKAFHEGRESAIKMLARLRENVARRMTAGDIPMDQRFLDGLSQAWSTLMFNIDMPLEEANLLEAGFGGEVSG